MDVLIGYIVFTSICELIASMVVVSEEYGFAWLNPVFIYNNIKVNWFGAAFLALIANIALPIIAIVYWLYKLCTVGRK